jgi:hypothetical protein
MPTVTPERFSRAMKKNPIILKSILRGVTHQEAQQARDEGPGGWNVIEVLCHLRDFDIIFMERARSMVEQNRPGITPVDHLEMVIEKKYAEQQFETVLGEYLAHRAEFNAWIATLLESDWGRVGIHPESGDITVLEQIVQASDHDTNHYEQIARILGHGG